MPDTDLYTYATTVLGMSPAELAAEGIGPGSTSVNIPDPGVTSAGGGGLSVTNQSSVQAILMATLKLFGIDGPDATQYAQQFIVDHPSISEPAAQAQLQLDLLDPSTGIGRVVDQQYPGLRQLREQHPDAPQVSIGGYITLRDQYKKAITDAGLAPYMGDLNAFGDQAIGQNKSPQEVRDRISAAQQLVYQEPPEVRADLQRMFGAGDSLGAATAYFLDPVNNLPLIQQQLHAAEIGGAAARTGYGLLTAEEASRLAQQGVSADQAQGGFTDLGKQAGLYNPLPGEQGDTIGRQDQLAAEFGGNVDAQQRIDRQKRARLAVFGGGGGWNAGQQGITGLGTAV